MRAENDTVNGTKGVYRLSLLGPPQITQNGMPLPGLRSRKAVGVLAYLALHDGLIPRTTLVDLFWPAQTEQRGRANLSWVLNHVQGAIPDAFIADRSSVCFNRDNPALRLDTADFLRLSAQGSAAARIQAVELVRGDLLEGFWLRDNIEFELWLRAEQERWRRLTADSLAALSAHFQDHGDPARAAEFLRRLLDLTPWRESAHQRLMRLLAQDGRRGAALAQFETCRQVLRQELNVEPSAETQALAAAIRDGTLSARPSAPTRAAPPEVTTHHLPRLFTSFFGREAELARIARLLASPDAALLTIIGPGGAGKTRLALAAAAQQRSRFAHGVHFVPLAGLQSHEQFAPAVAAVLGFTFSDSGGQSPRTQLLNYLAERNLLLILDNAEHLAELHNELLPLLQGAPGLRLLVTSRHELGLHAAAVLFLDGLPYPPGKEGEDPASYSAVQLLLDRIARRDENYAGPEWQGEAARISRLVQGYPLALELAAGLVPAQTPAQIADQIEIGLDALRAAYHDLPPRQLSLRALFEHSWRLLSPAEQDALPLLTLFRGSFSPTAAQAVCGVDPALIEGLAAKSLVQRVENGRFTLHEVPRHFLAERLQRDNPAAAHAAYYLSRFVEAAPALRGPQQLDLRADLRPDEDNLHAAWQWTCAAREPQTIAAALPGLYVYWSRCGYAPAAVDFFARGAAALRQRGWDDLAAAVQMHGLDCLSLEEAGRQENVAAIAAAGEVLPALSGLLQQTLAARLARLCMACLTTAMAGAAAGLEVLLARSEALVAAGGGPLDLADLDQTRAQMYRHQGDYPAARALLGDAAAVYRHHEDEHALAEALHQLARLEFRAGSYGAAAEHAAECQALFARLGDRQGLQDSQATLGLVAYQDGRYADAAAAFEASLALAKDMGNQVRTANNLNNLGVVALDTGDLAAAGRRFARALAAFGALNDDAGIAMVLANQGLLAERGGDLAEAQRFTERSLAIRERLGDRYGQAFSRSNLGFIYLAQGAYEDARQQFTAVREEGLATHNDNFQADALGGLALVRARTGRRVEGLALAREALAMDGTSRAVREKLEAFLREESAQNGPG